jgi:prepilin-type N-terminal cleavage/methylation domain-containing protein
MDFLPMVIVRRANPRQRLPAFTLIELLIVVAIIAILALIALPNFLEAQTRSKVARLRADMRSLATALEAYVVDHNAYPPAMANAMYFKLKPLSSPIAYVTNAYVADPFPAGDRESILHFRRYLSYLGRTHTGTCVRDDDPVVWWMLISNGPDGRYTNVAGEGPSPALNSGEPARIVALRYDPTNGTVSEGNIHRPGGSPAGTGHEAFRLLAAD